VEDNNFGTIDSTGLYTAPRDTTGSSHIVATSLAVPTVKGTASIGVEPIQVIISPGSVALSPSGKQMFTATIKGLTNMDVTWTVLEVGGGSISSDGAYTAPATVGFYHVIATSVADTTRSGNVTIAVTTSTSRFAPTGSMHDGRGFHTATLLPNGKVLVTGGAARASDHICLGGTDSAELYDPTAGSFTSTDLMRSLRYAHSATVLQNGKVLVIGGFPSTNDCLDLGEPALNSSELFNPSTGSFEYAASMLMGRGGHTATILPDGKVLVVGGGDQGGDVLPFYGNGTATAELYDPNTNVFTSTNNMANPRFGHTATVLSNGKVLIVGGFESNSSNPTTAAEVYDPATGVFTPTGNMKTARGGHTATRLLDGRVLITGGLNTGIVNGQFGVSSSAEVYDPSTGAFSLTGPMGEARSSHTATLLSNGTVLVAGGPDSTAELYDPTTGLFSPTGFMEVSRFGHSATLLQNNKVLVVGGGSFSPLVTAELYQ
jgi:N-acetylneuraminic acid mutarotase